MGGNQRSRRAGTDVTGQLLCRGKLRQLRGGLGGLIRKRIIFRLRFTGQKIQQFRLCSIGLRIIGGFETADTGKVIFDGDVDEGIALYLSTKSQAADFVDYSDFKRDNWFKRDNLRLQSVRVLVPSVEAIERTQPVRIHCVIKAQESVERVGLRLEVRDEVGNPLATSCLYDLNLHEGDSEVTAQYDLSVRSPGKYSNYFTLFTAGEGA